MTPIKLRIQCALIQLRAWLPQPPREDPKECGECGTSNEPWRTRCIGCGVRF